MHLRVLCAFVCVSCAYVCDRRVAHGNWGRSNMDKRVCTDRVLGDVGWPLSSKEKHRLSCSLCACVCIGSNGTSGR